MSKKEVLHAVLQDLWCFIANGFTLTTQKDFLHKSKVLVPGTYYGGGNIETAQLRLLINNYYSEAEVSRPLQASEYVAYILSERACEHLTNARRWSPGQWHQELKGKTGVHIGVVPMQGSVIEYIDENQEWIVGIVHEIKDDEAIMVGTVGAGTPGVYEEIFMSREDWHELRPVFISIMKQI